MLLRKWRIQYFTYCLRFHCWLSWWTIYDFGKPKLYTGITKIIKKNTRKQEKLHFFYNTYEKNKPNTVNALIAKFRLCGLLNNGTVALQMLTRTPQPFRCSTSSASSDFRLYDGAFKIELTLFPVLNLQIHSTASFASSCLPLAKSNFGLSGYINNNKRVIKPGNKLRNINIRQGRNIKPSNIKIDQS